MIFLSIYLFYVIIMMLEICVYVQYRLNLSTEMPQKHAHDVARLAKIDAVSWRRKRKEKINVAHKS